MPILDDVQRREAATRLLQAQHSVRPATRLSDDFPGMDADDAYGIQTAMVALQREHGQLVRGYKIGLTSKAMQDAVGINEPDYGHLFDNMLHSDGVRLSAGTFIVPRIEVELAFVLEQALKGPGVTVSDVLQATRHVIPALEIIDARTTLPRQFVDTLADNASSAGVITGGRPVRPMDVDLRWLGAVLSKNAMIEESGMSAAVLGHPAAGIAWLANRLGQRGTSLEPGQLLLGGSFTRPVAVAAGDVIHVDYGPLGSIAVAFTD